MIKFDAAFMINNDNQVMMILEQDIDLLSVEGFSYFGSTGILLYNGDNNYLIEDCPLSFIKLNDSVLVSILSDNVLLECKEIKKIKKELRKI